MTIESPPDPVALDVGALEVWLRGVAPSFIGDVNADRIGEGQSCLTYAISGADWRAILRRPPRGDLPSSAFDVLREHRIMLALGRGSAVPVPKMYGACADTRVIGAPFFVMEYVDGSILRNEIPSGTTAALLDKTTDQVIDTLVAIHHTDVSAAGLTTLGPGDGYIQRQLRRMQDQWNHTRARAIPALDLVGEWLAANIPLSARTTLVHGDYKLDNLVLDLPRTESVRAVIDWEMATLGDPLADLGWLLYFWRDPGEEEFPIPVCGVTDRDGFPRRRDIAERYARLSGINVDNMTWYIAFAGWKISIIMELSYQRFLGGVVDHPAFAKLGRGVPAMARRALEFSSQ
jgi:aminoglycoside phosphotransferase (APT) family kinase protein